MNWSHSAQIISDCLGLILVFRLAALKLHAVYRVFSLFLLFDLFSSLVTFVESALHNPKLDYRITWIAMRPIAWTLSLTMVYVLLYAILINLKGIRRFSRNLLNGTFCLAITLAILTGRAEYSVSGFSEFIGKIGRFLGIAFIVERVICSVALVALVSILGFILWFPVSISRNLAVFAFVFTVYFGAKTALLLIQSFVSHTISQSVSTVVIFVLAGCFAFLILSIRAEGEVRPVVLGHNWSQDEQQRLFKQLQAMNAALLKKRLN